MLGDLMLRPLTVGEMWTAAVAQLAMQLGPGSHTVTNHGVQNVWPAEALLKQLARHLHVRGGPYGMGAALRGVGNFHSVETIGVKTYRLDNPITSTEIMAQDDVGFFLTMTAKDSVSIKGKCHVLVLSRAPCIGDWYGVRDADRRIEFIKRCK